MVEGQDISETWERRQDQFDFEIEDVMNAQGFDGLPRVVSEKDFDKYVKESNFIAQRTYSATDKETLDAYRDQLYDGKWYVDCSTGGSQYGQGMYCAADYNGVISDGIKEEMAHYSLLNIERGNKYSYTETLTLDKSAKVITYDNLIEEKQKDIQKLVDKERNVEWKGKSEDEYFSNLKKARQETSKLRNLDDGVYAVLKGYDAINAEGHGASGSYTVILNRTKVIIRKG
jgi:uncharacterized protein YukE